MKNIIRFGILALAVLSVWFYTKRTPAPLAQGEKVLVTVNAAQIKSCDPAQAESVYDVREVSKVYEGLLEYHYLKRPCALIPNLAAAMPTISTDGCVYTFTIKKGVRFHDNACFPEGKGRELVAEDFVYAMKRVADPKLQSRWYSMLAGKIKGLSAWRDKYADAHQADYTEAIEGLKAVDTYTLQFTLTQPWPQFLYSLAMSFCYVVPQEAVQHYGAEFINHPVGTGPFVLKDFKPEQNKLIYHKNPTFRDKFFPSEAAEEHKHLLVDAGKKLPLVDKIITHILIEEQPRWLKFQQGQIDVLDLSRGDIALQVVQEGVLDAKLQEKGMQLFLEPEQNTSFCVFNNSHPLFKDNVKLRQAISLAFDGGRYNKLFHNDTAVQAQSIISPGLAGYREDYVSPYRTHDVEKANQLLAEAGYPGGKGLPEITLEISASTTARQKGEFFKNCMGKIGISIKVQSNTFPELMRKKAQKQMMMHVQAWSADYPDADTFLGLLYKADQSVGVGTYFSNATYNALYEKATVMKHSPERTALYEQLNRIAAEQVPAVYTLHGMRPVLYHGWVKNYLWADCLYGTEQYVNIDLEKKRQLQGNR